MTKLNKVLFGTGIALLFYAISRFLSGELVFGTFLFLFLSVVILVLSIMHRGQSGFAGWERGIIITTGVALILCASVGTLSVIANNSNTLTIWDTIYVMVVIIAPLLVIGVIILIVGIKSKKQLRQVQYSELR